VWIRARPPNVVSKNLARMSRASYWDFNRQRQLRGFAAALRGAAHSLIAVGWFPQFNTAYIHCFDEYIRAR